MGGTLEEKKSALVQLGVVMTAIGCGEAWPGHSIGLNEAEYAELNTVVQRARIQNGWATEENVRHAFAAWGRALAPEAITAWMSVYPRWGPSIVPVRTVGLILAGNIPLVGLHDVLCVWLSGHRARVKCSSQETDLIPAVVSILDRLLPGTAEQIAFTNEKLGQVDALIATGTGNTARYFDHYFGHLPRIVRKNRVSVAVLDGTETEEEFAGLGEDVFRYFGLGCRNVSKVFIPNDFDLDRLFRAFFPWREIVHHNKYANNYDYTRALWMLDQVNFLENGFLLMKEDAALASPVASLFFERYSAIEPVEERLARESASIQCVVGHGHVPFGHAQHPALSDYADGVDTLQFLIDLK